MSTATAVPETHELEGDDALRTLRRTGWGRLANDSVRRFRAADGFSHARALAYQIVLTLVPALIATVGLATALGAGKFRSIVQETVTRLAPGPAGDIVTQAFRQGARSGAGGATAALLFGLVAAIASATLAMGQIERGANRIYGIERDRPTTQKYGNAFLLAISAGLLSVLALVLIVAGSDIARASGVSGALGGLWAVLRWPLSIAFAVAAFALLFRAAPRRHQPAPSWLAIGSGMAVLLWLVFTGLLALYLSVGGSSMGRTYGPLTGIMAILIWAFLTSLALFLGLAFASQLEAVRAGVPSPVEGQAAGPTGPMRVEVHRRWRAMLR
jgi:YihY family inner membrane protein